MRIVVALGGNALLRRGERASIDAQRVNVRRAAAQLATVAAGNDLVIVHGNGPQVGLLASQSADSGGAERFPLDVLDAETEGMIGYLIELELRNHLSSARACTTMLTMVEVDPHDPAFSHPDKPIGTGMTEAEATASTRVENWTTARDGALYRRVVASPHPVRMLETDSVRWLLVHGSIVICAGGGGIPVVTDGHYGYRGMEAVIDKDRTAALLAREIAADLFVIATDVRGVYLDWGKPSARPIRSAGPDALTALSFAAGSMGPKVEAACEFATRTGRRAVIGALDDIAQMVGGNAGTSIEAGQHAVVEGAPDRANVGDASQETTS